MSDLITIHYYGSDVEVPKDTRYIATDSDGCVYAFNNDKPVFNEKVGTWCVYTNSFKLVDINFDVVPSRSLFEINPATF